MRMAISRLVFLVAGMMCVMPDQSLAGSKIVISCAPAAGIAPFTADYVAGVCGVLAKHLEADLGLVVSQTGGPGHKLRIQIKQRSAHAVEFTIHTAPIRGGKESTVSSVLVANDSQLTAFSLKTLVRPIAKQLGILK